MTTLTDALELLNPPKGFSPWHGGPTLMGCLRGVDAQQASWKPAPNRHSIWELALHISYWNYRVCRHLTDKEVNTFDRSPANFPEVKDFSESNWKTDKAFIKNEHQKLVKCLEAFPERRLNEFISSKKGTTFRQLISGIAAHDTYHIGQIQLMKRLFAELGK